MIRKLVTKMLAELGEDPTREGLKRTPQRFEFVLKKMTSGYKKKVKLERTYG